MKLVSVNKHIKIRGSLEEDVWDAIHMSDFYKTVPIVGDCVWPHQVANLLDCVKHDLEVYIIRKI